MNTGSEIKKPNEINPSDKRKKQHVFFKPENERFFNTTFQSLVNLLRDDQRAWNISENAQKLICTYLSIYCDECRNEHFHKDNINSLDEVEIIRNNTILLFYYLIGGYNFNSDNQITNHILGIKDSTYDRLYRSVVNGHGFGNYYILKFADAGDVLVAMPSQPNPIYDDDGMLKDTRLKFVRLNRTQLGDWHQDNWSIIERETIVDNLLFIDSNNLPLSIVYIDKITGKQEEIKWN